MIADHKRYLRESGQAGFSGRALTSEELEALVADEDFAWAEAARAEARLADVTRKDPDGG
jgi:hypothetical protein